MIEITMYKNIKHVKKTMSKALKEISYQTGDGVQFTIHINVPTRKSDVNPQVISLGIPDNEPLENAERDMDELIKNSFADWED